MLLFFFLVFMKQEIIKVEYNQSYFVQFSLDYPKVQKEKYCNK